MNHSPTNHTQYIIYLVISIDWFASRLDFVLTNQQIRLVSYRGIASFFVFPLEIWNQSFVLPKKEGGGGRKRLPFHVISSNTIYRNPPPPTTTNMYINAAICMQIGSAKVRSSVLTFWIRSYKFLLQGLYFTAKFSYLVLAWKVPILSVREVKLTRNTS